MAWSLVTLTEEQEAIVQARFDKEINHCETHEERGFIWVRIARQAVDEFAKKRRSKKKKPVKGKKLSNVSKKTITSSSTEQKEQSPAETTGGSRK